MYTKNIILFSLLVFPCISFACGDGGIPVKTQVRLHSLDKSVLEIKIEVPERYKNYKFSGTAYHKGDNLIPMNRGLSDLGKIFYFLKGNQEFFKNASIQVGYTYGIDRFLCSYKEKIDLNREIERQL